MDVKTSSSAKGKAAADSLKRAARAEEKKIEAEKGSSLKKGERRFMERAAQANGKGAGESQR